jgi:hypothetical protein
LSDIENLVATRMRRPEAIADALAARARPAWPPEGRLLIIAADHTARGITTAGRAEMTNRADLLERIVLALSRPGVSGVLGSPDILEDLLLLGALEGKVVFGSMNRGGLAGASWTLDDRFTGYDAPSIAASRFEGGKMLLRLDPNDARTAPTLEACAYAISELAERKLVALVEPFWSDTSAEGAMKAIGIASALGTTSAYTWLKVPVVEKMKRVLASSTLPMLVLGGAGPAAFDAWEKALKSPTVRGLVVGRSLLYPVGDDVAAAVDTAAALLKDVKP